jgi:DNA-binding transcriptional LysR family regulator
MPDAGHQQDLCERRAEIDTAAMNLGSLDLNLLVALDALLQQRSVTRAAEQMGLSQPALSASLARLRRHFDDPLLARVGNEYRLTPLAVQLKERTRLALAGAERVFTAQAEFDPAASTREFSVIISDYGVEVLGTRLAATIAEEAPRARLRLSAPTPYVVDRAAQVLLSTDLLVLPHGFVSELRHRDLYRDGWLCLVSEDNDEVGEKLTVDQLAELPWVASYHGPTASTSAALQLRMLGVEPHVQVVTENFLTVPGLVAGSRRVALLQRRLMELIPPGLGIRALPCPVEVTPLVEAMWWHPAYDDDPEHAYLRDVIVRASADAAGPSIDGH